MECRFLDSALLKSLKLHKLCTRSLTRSRSLSVRGQTIWDPHAPRLPVPAQKKWTSKIIAALYATNISLCVQQLSHDTYLSFSNLVAVSVRGQKIPLGGDVD